MSQSSKLSFWQRIKQLLTLPLSNRMGEMTPSVEHIDTQNNQQQPPTSSGQTSSNSMDNDLNSRAQPPSNPAYSQAQKPSFAPADHDADTSNLELKNKSTSAPSDGSHYQPETTDGSAIESCPLSDRFREYLDLQNWHYSYHPAKANDTLATHHISLRMKNDPLSWVCLIRIQERSQLVAVYGILPFTIPESHRHAAMLLATQLNYDMMLGNIELDLSDGEIRYKSSLDIEATGSSDAVIHYLLQSVIAMTTVTYELFKELLDNPNPSTDIETLLEQIRQQADARTFFLASEQIQ